VSVCPELLQKGQAGAGAAGAPRQQGQAEKPRVEQVGQSSGELLASKGEQSAPSSRKRDSAVNTRIMSSAKVKSKPSTDNRDKIGNHGIT